MSDQRLKLTSTTEAEALSDLALGASKRLGGAAWLAKLLCEEITHADHDPLDRVARAREALNDAERHAKALKAYRKVADV